MHPLDSAYERVKRAGKHLSYLKRRANILSQIVTDKVSTDEYMNTLLQDRPQNISHISLAVATSRFTSGREDIIMGILVGEVIYNLRAALDYLVYELARLDSGKIVKGTQFPIDKCEKTFKSRRNGFLKGISDEHITAIKTLQPCKGCQWTEIIAAISNADKHRQLSIFFPSIWFSISHNRTKSPSIQSPMYMDNSPFVQIKFSEGTINVDIKTLYELKAYVTETLKSFKSEFK